jgi:nitroreductase
MDTLEAIRSRRSIRQYQDRPVPAEIVDRLLAAAMSAPSARNGQPWQMIVVDDRGLLAEIARLNPNARMAARAPLGILICGDLGLEKSPGFWVVDCAAAMENLLLAAHATGLGGVWIGIYPRQERMDICRRLFALPEQVMAHSLAILGFPAEQPAAVERFRPDRVHRNRW